MKKQINPTIKAHLIRGAFYLLLLVAVCAIPFALGQRNAPKRGMTNSAKFVPSQPNAGSQLRPNDVRPSIFADSIVNHVQGQSAGQAPSRPVVPPHQIEGIDCDTAPGIIIHDDGGIDDGYSGNPAVVTEVRFVDKFTP